jgi:predicted HTH domain antitoxin
MATVAVDIPEEVLKLFEHSRLKAHPLADRVRMALAIHLFQEGLISAGKAAEISDEPRASFDLLLADLGIPAMRYGVAEHEADSKAFERASDT